MGRSISQATHDRIERNRAEDRLCQDGGRCSTRATVRLTERADGTFDTVTPVGETTEFKVCKRHAAGIEKSLEAWGFWVRGYTHVSTEEF